MWGATFAGCSNQRRSGNFNPRAPCGARPFRAICASRPFIFQSTRPVWGATNVAVRSAPAVQYFNPRAPCGARLPFSFQIRRDFQFQSTRPVWGATLSNTRLSSRREISIHAPRVGRDAGKRFDQVRRTDFNPRAPCGARPAGSKYNLDVKDFNPRAPCGARPEARLKDLRF